MLAGQNVSLQWQDGTAIQAYGDPVLAFQASERQHQDSGLFNAPGFMGAMIAVPVAQGQYGDEAIERYTEIVRLNASDQAGGYTALSQQASAMVRDAIVPDTTLDELILGGGAIGKSVLSAVKAVARGVGVKGTDSAAHNAASYAKLKLDLKVTASANSVVDSLRATGQLPANYVNKTQAAQQGWQPGKALNNSVPGGQIGGDVFHNTTNVLPSSPGRTWFEADIGLNSTMSRSNQPGTRLLYSNDGLLYITTDHYKTVAPIGTWK